MNAVGKSWRAKSGKQLPRKVSFAASGERRNTSFRKFTGGRVTPRRLIGSRIERRNCIANLSENRRLRRCLAWKRGYARLKNPAFHVSSPPLHIEQTSIRFSIGSVCRRHLTLSFRLKM